MLGLSFPLLYGGPLPVGVDGVGLPLFHTVTPEEWDFSDFGVILVEGGGKVVGAGEVLDRVEPLDGTWRVIDVAVVAPVVVTVGVVEVIQVPDVVRSVLKRGTIVVSINPFDP